jgi:hypothetical protein
VAGVGLRQAGELAAATRGEHLDDFKPEGSMKHGAHPRIRHVLLAAFLPWFALEGAAQGGPSVTVYTRDLAFVRELRTLEGGRDRDTVRIGDIPERLDFSSLQLVPVQGKVTHLAYRFDVASGDRVLEGARGRRVRISVRGEHVIQGTLVAVDGSWVVVRENNGGLNTIARGSIDQVLVEDPGALMVRPTVEAVIEGRRRGEAELSYLTGGLSWSAEHTVVREREGAASWASWVTLENTSGRDYVDARLKLVAGEPSRVGPGPIQPMRKEMLQMSADASSGLVEESFAEYHLYSLPRPASLRDREAQRLVMLEPRDIDITPRYLYRGGERGVRTQIEVRNTSDAGLGVPLPAGRVRFYERDSASELQFTGESHIQHTPESEKLTLEVGTAFDLVAERRELWNKRISDREREYAIEIKLRNRKKTGVTIVVEERAGGDVEITERSHDITRKDAQVIQFTVPVPAGKEAVLRYTARVRY